VSKRYYPRVGRVEKLPPQSKKVCSYCAERAVAIVHIEHDCYRGNDTVRKACAHHKTCSIEAEVLMHVMRASQ
jgi:hypothetical protein